MDVTRSHAARGRPVSSSSGRRPASTARSSQATWFELQRLAGNSSVSSLVVAGRPTVQREGTEKHVLDPADESDVPTWVDTQALMTEWGELDREKKAATREKKEFTKQARFDEVNRLIGLRFKKDTAMTLEGNGYKDGPAKWYEDVKPHKFLGQTITVHSKFGAKLAEAEKAFLDVVGTETAPSGGWTRVTSDLRGPGEGLHSYGLAIDLKGGTNPYLITPSSTSAGATGEPKARSQAVQDVIDRAILLVLGKTADEYALGAQPAETDRKKRAMASYDKLEESSTALQTYFSLTDPSKKATLDASVAIIAAKDPLKRTADDWLKAIADDKPNLEAAAAKKNWKNSTQGFLDLDRRLVEAMVGVGISWLGDVLVSGRDIMHFDMRALGPIKKTFRSSKGWTNLGG